MTLPKMTQTIKDGGLGLAEADASQVHVALGVCSSGTVNALVFYTDPDRLKTECGVGPLVDKAIYHLQVAGGPVGVMRVNSSVAGACGSVTTTRGGDGTSTGTVTPSGAANDSYEFRVETMVAGANLVAATGQFRYSVDGGDTFSPNIAIPTSGTYVVPGTDVTLTFANGAGTAFAVGDVYVFVCTAPGYSTADAGAAFDALRAAYATAQFGFVHLVGASATVSGAATMAASIDVKMTTEELAFRYLFAVVECTEDTDANIIAAFANFVSARVVVAAGYCELVANGKVMKRNAAWPAVARAAKQGIQRDLARTRNDSEGGALPGVTKLYRDEFVTQALDAARFLTLRTFPGKNGFYITNGRTMAGPGSDFQLLQYRRLMDRALTVNYATMFPFLNDDAVDVADDGTIREIDARAIETQANAALKADLTSKKRVSATNIVLVRDGNILSTQTLKTKVRIRPRGYAKFIESEVGFDNPALSPTAPAP